MRPMIVILSKICHRKTNFLSSIKLHRKSLLDNVLCKLGAWDTCHAQCSTSHVDNTKLTEFSHDVAKRIEKEWKEKVLSVPKWDETKPKYYVLSMFPYPSGRLHMGHVRVYTISDVMARYKRMHGYQVIHPMGWDAFGLPAENAARDHNLPPHVWTNRNIDGMKTQLKDLSCCFDWDREFATCDPQYYRWTQYIFLKLYESGLVYRKQESVNWDPVDETVLADEQIDENGRSWRSGVKVEKRYLHQWFINTTAYAKSLLDGLDEVDPDLWGHVILMQKNWIGDCDGCRFNFNIQDSDESLSIHTRQPEAIYGTAFIALSPLHRYNQPQYYQNENDTNDFIRLKISVIHPFTHEHIPVFVSKSIEFPPDVDTHLGIPSVNDEDRAIAVRMNLSYKEVLDDQQNIINSHQFSRLKRAEATQAIMQHAQDLKVGGPLTSARLRDWLISRQRYWGTPIPMIHCPNCKTVPVPYRDLPVALPPLDHTNNKPTSLCDIHDWVNTKCPQCGSDARRETDTIDTFVDSSWYFLRFLDPTNQNEPFSKEAATKHMPVDLYIGGLEHAVLHLYFARFVTHFLYDLDLVPCREPFKNLLTQGMVMGQSYRLKSTGKYLRKSEVDLTGKEPVCKGEAVIEQWEKMSKSKYNGIDPQEVIEEYGCDLTRACILSSVAPQTHRHWSNDDFKGVINWQRRLWTVVQRFIEQRSSTSTNSPSDQQLAKVSADMFDSRNYFLKEVLFHMEVTFLLNTAVSRLHGLTNSLMKVPESCVPCSPNFERALATLLIIATPVCPNLCSHLWSKVSEVASPSQEFTWERNVLEQSWPTVDMDYMLPFSVKTNGQNLFNIKIPRSQLDNLTMDQAMDIVSTHKQYQKYWAWKTLLDRQLRIDKSMRGVMSLTMEKPGDKENVIAIEGDRLVYKQKG